MLDVDYRNGHGAGAYWAQTASPDELDRLSVALESCRVDGDDPFIECSMTAWGPGERLAAMTMPEGEFDRQAAHDFWNNQPIDDVDKVMYCASFVRGFADGALEQHG